MSGESLDIAERERERDEGMYECVERYKASVCVWASMLSLTKALSLTRQVFAT